MSFRTIQEVKRDYKIGKKPQLFPIESTENSLIELEHEAKRKTRMRSRLGQMAEQVSAIPSPSPKSRPITRPRVSPKVSTKQSISPKKAQIANEVERYTDSLESKAVDFNSLLTSYYEELEGF